MDSALVAGVAPGGRGMLARAQDTVFWPGIYADLEAVRARCGECNVKQHSQAALPPSPLASPFFLILSYLLYTPL